MPAPDASPHAKLSDYATYAAYKLVCALLCILGVRAVAIFGRMVGYAVWALMPGRRRIVARNLRIVCHPSLRADKLAPMVRRNIVRTTMNLACSLKTGLMTHREMQRAIRVEGGDVFEAHGSGGHTVISCIPHAGNWEILARIRPLFSRVEHFGSMYRRLSNPLLEEFVYRSRTRYGCEMYSKEDGLRAVMKLARGGGLLGVLSDQFTAEGLYLPYFGKVTGVTPLPALLYKRCKGKGHLFSVFTRNTGLGRWDAVLGRIIHLPEGCDSLPGITMQVNLALEKCQKENILDGFWMHHRWKTTDLFAAFEQDEFTRAAIAQHARLPFRIIVSTPADADELQALTHVVQALSTSRPDAQVTLLCPQAQVTFWQGKPGVAHILTTDGPASLADQLAAEAVYNDGPFDILFMFGGDRKLYRRLKPLFPLYVIGWEEHPLSSRFRTRYTRPDKRKGQPFTLKDYAQAFAEWHRITLPLS